MDVGYLVKFYRHVKVMVSRPMCHKWVEYAIFRCHFVCVGQQSCAHYNSPECRGSSVGCVGGWMNTRGLRNSKLECDVGRPGLRKGRKRVKRAWVWRLTRCRLTQLSKLGHADDRSNLVTSLTCIRGAIMMHGFPSTAPYPHYWVWARNTGSWDLIRCRLSQLTPFLRQMKDLS